MFVGHIIHIRMTVHWFHLLRVRLLVPGPVVLRPVFFVSASVRLSNLKALSAALRAAGGGFRVDRRAETVENKNSGRRTTGPGR